MYYYVCIDQINGRRAFYQLADMMEKRGYDDRVEYFQGTDCAHRGYILPHLRFLDEQDALAYCLTHGGSISKSLPTTYTTVED